MTKSEALYRVAPSTDTLDHLEIEQNPPRRYTILRHALSTDRFITTFLAAICLFGLAFGLGVTATLAWTSTDHQALYWLTRMKEMSPITPDIPLSYHEQRFNGSLLKETIYRQNASEEVDKAWQALGINCRLTEVPLTSRFDTNQDTDRSVVVPAGIAGRIGIADDQVKISSRHGGGYVANVEGLHQLHCLVSFSWSTCLRSTHIITESVATITLVQLRLLRSQGTGSFQEQ